MDIVLSLNSAQSPSLSLSLCLSAYTMKLRLRNTETKETLKVEAPENCTLHHLKLIISELPSLSSPPPSSLLLSLNRKDDLTPVGSDPATVTLHSLGLTSGDLLFFSLIDNPFNSQTLIPQSITTTSSINNNNNMCIGLIVGSEPVVSSESVNNMVIGLVEEAPKLTNEKETMNFASNSKMGEDQNMESDTQLEEETLVYGSKTENQAGIEESMEMEIDGVDDDTGTMGKGFSVPVFLRKVFNKELGDSGGCDPKLVVIAVHALLKESGFLAFDTVSKKIIDGFCCLPDTWPSSGCTLSLCYTLLEIVQSSSVVETIVVKVQRLGKYVNFYGSLAGKGSGIYRVCLDEQRLATVLNLMWANLDTVESNGSVLHPEKEVFEFWKTVKDKLTLPLLIDLCEMANLPPPSCFVRLPTDLKLCILELLPGADVAKVARASRELRFLSSYDDLWKKKYIEEFGDVDNVNVGAFVVENSWKRRFVKAWEAKKRRVSQVLGGGRGWYPNNFRDPGMFRSPRIIGGDYDMTPNFLLGGGYSRRRRGTGFLHGTFGNRRS